MKLQEINKHRYRKHLNIVITALIISLMVMALSFGQLLIALLSDGQGSNFIFNLSGVILAAVICLYTTYKLREHNFMIEVVYVWFLKLEINKIYRKLKKVQTAAKEHGDINAIIILNYYYAASTQLYKLDDNTITMESLQLETIELQNQIKTNNLNIKSEDYHPDMLNKFK